VNIIKGFRNSECPHHLGGWYIAEARRKIYKLRISGIFDV
jgi:hypothetical protein